MKVVVVDAGQLPHEVEFPPLKAEKYGWEQYPGLEPDDIVERCWRSDIVVSLAPPIDRRMLEKMHKLKLIITAGDACAGLDEKAVRECGVDLLMFPNACYDDAGQAQDCCKRISEAIDYYLDSIKD